MIKWYYWFPKGNLRDAYWRALLPYQVQAIHAWLMGKPHDAIELKDIVCDEKSYAKRSIIQTDLLAEVTCKKGVYVTHSDANKSDVFFYHQSCNDPYVIFNEVRDKVIAEAIDKNIITLCNPNIRKPCGLFNAKDILFSYRGVEYNWHAKGVIYKQDNPMNQLSQPNSIASLLNAFIILQIIDLIKVFQTNSEFP